MATDYTDDANCQGAWLFADDLTDESGKGNTLTDDGSIAYSTTRPTGFTTGKSAQFDGSTDSLSRTNANLSAGFPGKGATQDWAYAFWYYTTNYNSPGFPRNIIVKTDGFRAQMQVDGSFHFTELAVYHYDAGWALDQNDAATGIGQNTWYHVVCSFDGDGTDTDCTYWVSTESDFGDVVDNSAAPYEMTGVGEVGTGGGGTFYVGGTEYHVGYIYQLIIFNRKLSAAEAEEIYTSGITGEDGGAPPATAGITMSVLKPAVFGGLIVR